MRPKRFIENIEKDNLDCISKIIYDVRDSLFGRWVVRRAGALPIQVCKSCRPGGTCLVLLYKARLIAYINFCYKTRPGTDSWRRVVLDLRLLSRTHIFLAHLTASEGMTGTRVSRFVVIRVARGAPACTTGGLRTPHNAQRYRP